MADFIAMHGRSEVTARLDRVYRTERSTLDAAVRRAQARSLGSDFR